MPVVLVPVQQSCCDALKVPYEIDADPTNTTADALVGGNEKSCLSLEYLVEDKAVSPSVKVTVVSDGTSSTWSDDAPTTGYHVLESLLTVKQGSKVSLAVNNATARLRWCEAICC
jgi:hypothetical protein